MNTTTQVAVLATGEQIDGLTRPTDRSLRNDGIRGHWLQDGAVYRLAENTAGPGWRVESDAWTGDWAGHVYRLVESLDSQLVNTLPGIDGTLVTLEPGTAYEIRQTEPGGAWGLYTA
ncbi:hypothetical protein [Micromonospora sp. RP3T]|uniref:hypothetical protein n=1 Tax=Micromonospora sp. RP3T TaxID=2135446 RepID=UPI003D7120CB